MSLAALVGHDQAKVLLGRAAREGTLPQSILLHGPAGVGKERLGLWLAQVLLCDKGGMEPCRGCQPCRLVERLEHPDLHWFFPLPRPESTSPEKLRERLEEARATELQLWRERPLRVPQFEKAPAHFLASVRTMLQLASLRPSMGRRKVFVIGDAELMVPQEASTEAANAFLKLLEEPPPETTLILTSSQPGGLLPTILSRVLNLRVGLVGAADIQALLEAGGIPSAKASEAARLSRGSARRAIEITTGEKTGSAAGNSEVGRELLLAALSTTAVSRLAAAHNRKSTGARGDLMGELEGLAEWLRDLLATTTGTEAHVYDPENLPMLRRMAAAVKTGPEGVMRALTRIEPARELAFGNVNPQLIVATLIAQIQVDLTGPGAGESAA